MKTRQLVNSMFGISKSIPFHESQTVHLSSNTTTTRNMNSRLKEKVNSCEVRHSVFASSMIGIHTIRKNGTATFCPIELG